MKFSQMTTSKWIRKDDLEEDVIVTIRDFKEQNVAPENQQPEMKWVVYFDEFPDKGLVLNATNIVAIQTATNGATTDEARGKEVILYFDPTIAYAGKVTGGIRIRAVRRQAEPKRMRPAAQESQGHADEDIPASAYDD